MPMFNAAAVARIRRAVLRSEDDLPVYGEQSELLPQQQRQDCHVKVKTALGGGYYHGVLALHDAATDAFAEDAMTVLVRALDHSALTLDQVLWARAQDVVTVGTEALPLYLVDPAAGGGGGGAPPAGEVCDIDGGTGWVSACDPVTGAGGAFTAPVQITLPAGATGPSFTVNQPGTTAPAYTLTSTATTTSEKFYPPGSANPALQTTASGSTVTQTSYLTGTTTPWLTQTATTTGGVLQFPVSTSPSVPPVGLFSPPTLTVGGPPTWTPAAGIYPELWDPVSGKDYLWDGSSWRALSTDPLTTKGDLWVYGTTDARLPVGADYTLLGAKSTVALGVAYLACVQSVVSDATGIHLAGDSGSPAANSYYGTSGTGGSGGLGYYPLPSGTSTAIATWVKVGSITYTMLSFAATSHTFANFYSLAARGSVSRAFVRVKTAFAASGLSTFTVQPQISGNGFASLSGWTAGTIGQGDQSDPYLGQIWNFTAATPVDVLVSANVNLNTLTAGEVELWLEVSTLPP